jgi:hypothetical protein
MRLVPVVPLALPHYTHTDVALDTGTPGTRFHVPADTIIVANLWSMGRDADLWQDSERFHPERFLVATANHVIASARSSGKVFVSGNIPANIERNSAGYSNSMTRDKVTLTGTDRMVVVSDKGHTNKEVGFTSDDDFSRPVSAENKCHLGRNNDVIDLTDSKSNLRVSADNVGCATFTGSGNDVSLAVDRKLADAVCPFGVGRRRCVGEVLGRMQVFVFFATVMRACHVTESGGQKLTMDETFGDVVKPRPYKVRVDRR